jgi:hypothetical protein
MTNNFFQVHLIPIISTDLKSASNFAILEYSYAKNIIKNI